MALAKCPECDGKVSEYAQSCPHCGFPIASSFGSKKAEGEEERKNEGLGSSAISRRTLAGYPRW